MFIDELIVWWMFAIRASHFNRDLSIHWFDCDRGIYKRMRIGPFHSTEMYF